MPALTIPEKFNVVECIPPTASGGALTGDYICVKNAKRISIVVSVTRGADATDILLSPMMATADGVGGTAFTATVPIWKNIDTGTAEPLARATDAVSILTGTVQSKNHVYVFQIDPAILAEGYDWIYFLTGAGNAAHFISAVYLVETQYQQAIPPVVAS